jgi:glycosyltransferase involved in cell wall biosynthesis
MKFSPIVVFAYNRPNYLKETLEALSKNEEAKESILYIYCDGPKEDSSQLELDKIGAARAVAREKKWCKEVIIIESNTNMGLSKAIITGVNEIVEKYGRIIVLEDDLVTSPYFLNYINIALNKYENAVDVISVVGFSYPIIFKDDFPPTYFLKNADCLGWATWKRGWDLFEADACTLLQQLEDKKLVKEFNFNDQYPFIKMLKLVAEGKLNSWAIRWYASSFVHNKLTLFPKKSLVRHIGNVGSNIKADNSDMFGWELGDKPVTSLETCIMEKTENRNLLSLHFRKYNRKRLSSTTLLYVYKRFILPLFNKNK